MVANFGNRCDKAANARSGQSMARTVTGYGAKPRKSREDGYDQAFVDAMRSASVAFGVALTSTGDRCDAGPRACRQMQGTRTGPDRTGYSRRP